MAIDLSTPVATAAEFRNRVGVVSTDDDSATSALLLSVTRLVERRMGLAPGMLLPQTALTFTFSAVGGSRLYLRDERGFQYLLRSITADSLKIDTDSDGSFDDYLLDTADAWVQPFPVNAATFAEPYTAIDLRAISSATITTWPNAAYCVQIVGDWGCTATSALRASMKERVIQITREIIETQHAGGAWTSVDEAATSIPSVRSLMSMIEREFTYRLPGIG